MKMNPLAAAAAVAVLALSSCATEVEHQVVDDGATVQAAPEHQVVDDGATLDLGPEVDWANYAPEVRAAIDGASSCGELQSYFDAAALNDADQRARAGSGNADVMQYVVWRMEALGC